MAKTYLLWEPLSDNILQERDETGAVVAEYTSEAEMFGNVISQSRVGVELQFHYDALGSTLGVTDHVQQVTDTRSYTAFGDATEDTGTNTFPYQYIGRQAYYHDSLTGLYFVRRRHYHPLLTRWLSADPLGYLDGMNLFQYGQGNPTSLMDVSGLVTKDFSPISHVGAPWCSVGTSNKTPGGKEEGDPNGLPAGVYGNTQEIKYAINCACVCKDESKGTYELTCIVWAYLKIRIAPQNITRGTFTTGKAYGHEQLHVRNLIKHANASADLVASTFESLTFKSIDKCRAAERLADEKVGALLASRLELERTHGESEGIEESFEPRKGVPYPPQSMPRTPDCTKPGMPTKDVTEKLCC